MDPPNNSSIFSGFVSHYKNSSRQRKTEALFALFIDAEEVEKEKLAGTVDYIKENKKELLRKIKYCEQGSLYLTPKQHGVPYHVQIFNRGKRKKPGIYIFPKCELLGEGTFKIVRVGLDYRKCAVVAEAAFREGDNMIGKGKEEIELQKKFGVCLAHCCYIRNGREKLKSVMPFANRGSLENLIYPSDRGFYDSLSCGQRKELLAGILQCVEKIHQAGYVVADIKPENILWAIDDKNHVKVFITDFGISYHKADETKERVCGTSRTVAPEIVDNVLGFPEPIGIPADIFALGFVLWTVFVGGTPPWLKSCPRLQQGSQKFLEPESYEISWGLFSPVEGTLEYYIYQMMNPVQEERPGIQEIVQSLKGVDPKKMLGKRCGAVRLMTCEESLNSIDLFIKERRKLEARKLWLHSGCEQDEEAVACNNYLQIPLNQYYILSENDLMRDFVKIFFFTDEDGHYQSVSLMNNKKTVNAFIQASGFTVCLNFWQFVL
jgi:serine/threonine protein kinase